MKNDRSWTEIDLTSFENNLNELKKFFYPLANFMQIVKADAYGHGAYQIARKAIENGAVSLGVANVQEAILLRYQNIKIPIVILSPSLETEIDKILEYNLIPSVSNLDFAQKLYETGKCKIHINIDTGMGRSGFHFKDALENITKIMEIKNLQVEGIFSHFSSAENDPNFTKLQSDRFENILNQLDFTPKYIHIANSSGSVLYQNRYTNLVRLGLLTFGIYPNDELKGKIKLSQIMTFKSRIIQIKTAYRGEPIGYNKTYIAEKKITYAILPVGYADGYDFLLSNNSKVLLNNTLCDVVGKISMDMLAIDISSLTNPKLGDEAILLGNAVENIKAEFLASLYAGSSYELLSQIGRRAKRYFFENGKTIDSSPILRRDFIPIDLSDNKLGNIIETAIEQRLQSKEIANLISSDLLQRFFAEKDRNINYRSNFQHTIEFEDSAKSPLMRGNQRGLGYYLTKTTLSFTKKLQNDYFYVTCAKSEEDLEKYFLRNDVEYRWLLDDNFDLEERNFMVTSVKINDLELYNEMKIADGCIEIKCYHSKLNELIGEDVKFSISTQTYYPKNSHQLSVFVIDMTKGVNIKFQYPDELKSVEAVPIFSGKSKFPIITTEKNSISVQSEKKEWIFPTSGVVFVY